MCKIFNLSRFSKVLDPSARLGAGEPGSENDIEALHAHSFFKGINWDTLWVDEVPPIKSGLYQRISRGTDWDNGGVSWDDLVNDNNRYLDDELSDDEREQVGYATKFESPYTFEEPGPSTFSNYSWNTADQVDVPPDLFIKAGQISDEPIEHNGDLAVSKSAPANPEFNVDSYTLREVPIGKDDSQEKLDVTTPVIIMNSDSRPMDVPRIQQEENNIRASVSTGSSTSSSEGGSSVDKVSATLQSITLQSDNDRRGRERIQTPIQHGLIGSAGGEWYATFAKK